MGEQEPWSVGMGEHFTLYVQPLAPDGGELGFPDEMAALRYAIDAETDQRDSKTRNLRDLRRRLKALDASLSTEGNEG